MIEKIEKFVSKYMPRWFNRSYASLFGYFWLPCPLCKKKFGGHEWFDDNHLMINYEESEGVCPKCGDRAREINKRIIILYPKQ